MNVTLTRDTEGWRIFLVGIGLLAGPVATIDLAMEIVHERGYAVEGVWFFADERPIAVTKA